MQASLQKQNTTKLSLSCVRDIILFFTVLKLCHTCQKKCSHVNSLKEINSPDCKCIQFFLFSSKEEILETLPPNGQSYSCWSQYEGYVLYLASGWETFAPTPFSCKILTGFSNFYFDSAQKSPFLKPQLDFSGLLWFRSLMCHRVDFCFIF